MKRKCPLAIANLFVNLLNCLKLWTPSIAPVARVAVAVAPASTPPPLARCSRASSVARGTAEMRFCPTTLHPCRCQALSPARGIVVRYYYLLRFNGALRGGLRPRVFRVFRPPCRRWYCSEAAGTAAADIALRYGAPCSTTQAADGTFSARCACVSVTICTILK